ncbi:MAG: hypothetical protein AAFW47_07185 [Pseudomonadota bacterium]
MSLVAWAGSLLTIAALITLTTDVEPIASYVIIAMGFALFVLPFMLGLRVTTANRLDELKQRAQFKPKHQQRYRQPSAQPIAAQHVARQPAPPPREPEATQPAKTYGRLDEPYGHDWTIVYVDSKKKESERSIVPRLIKPDGKSLSSFCHMADRPRTFKIDRIKSIVHESTGEVVDRNIPEWIEREMGY